MKTLNKKTWQYEKHGIDGEVELFGVNIFDYKWEDTKEIAKECDNVWCFYLPKE